MSLGRVQLLWHSKQCTMHGNNAEQDLSEIMPPPARSLCVRGFKNLTGSRFQSNCLRPGHRVIQSAFSGCDSVVHSLSVTLSNHTILGNPSYNDPCPKDHLSFDRQTWPIGWPNSSVNLLKEDVF